jgi:ABC-type glycerol-3-phosphate transport system substrate-binding protein
MSWGGENMLRVITIPALAATLAVSASWAGAQTTVNFVGAETPATWESAIAAFEAGHPGIEVEYQQIPFASFNAQIEARVGSQDPSIDVFMADTPRVPALSSRGYLLDLDHLADRIASIATPTEQDVLKYQGTYRALPLWTGTQMLFYNRDMLDKAGIAYPSDNPSDRMTWEAFLDLARAAQDGSDADFGFTFHQVDRYFQLQPLFESRGFGPGLSGDDLMTPAVDSEGWIEVTSWYRDLFESGLAPRGVAVDQMPDLFINGQVPFIYGGLPLIRRFAGAEGLNFGVAPVPYFEGGKEVTSTGSWAIGVSPYAANLEEALALAEFLTLDPEGSRLVSENTSAVPVNATTYAAYLERLAEMSDGVGDAGAILTYEIQHTAVPRPRSRGYVNFEEVMNQAFADIRNGADVAATLTATQQRLASVLSRL